MKAVAFNGSPRSGGNTEALLKAVLAPIEEAGIETEFVQLGGRSIHGCTACNKCWDTPNGRCVINRDFFNGCFKKMVAADAIIIGSPTYFADVTTETKALIDRAGFVALANGGLFARKVGAGVVAVRRGGAVHVLDSINHMFLMSRMIVPGSTYWNFGMGMNRGDVAGDEEAARNMRDLGETISWLIKLTAAERAG